MTWSCFLVDHSSTPRSYMLTVNWSASHQLGFLTMLCSFALFVSSFGFIGLEKPHWGSGQLRYFFIVFFFFSEKSGFHCIITTAVKNC